MIVNGIALDKTLHDKKNLFALCAIGLLGLGQESFFWWLAPLAAGLGYGCLFWSLPKERPFTKALLLFTAIHALQNMWMLSHPFLYIIVIWLSASILFAIPFAIITSYFCCTPSFSCMALASWMAFSEWAIAYCGYFPFHMASLYLSWNLSALQACSYIGAIGLSWWIFFTNALLFRKHLFLWSTAVFLPYCLGFVIYSHPSQPSHYCSTAMVHTYEPTEIEPSSPTLLVQKTWDRLFAVFEKIHPHHYQLIIVPEGSVPYSASSPLFSADHLPWFLQGSFNKELSSLDISTLLAQKLHTSILIGLEGRSYTNQQWFSHNSCFCISASHTMRYDKQLLVPFGEYVPYSWCASIVSTYGVHGSFTPGTETKIFQHPAAKIAPLICYEALFEKYTMPAAKQGASCLVAISSDWWFPSCSFKHKVLEITKIRAIETGIPYLRTCNAGVSVAYDKDGSLLGSTEQQQYLYLPISMPQYKEQSFFVQAHPYIVSMIILSLVIGFMRSKQLF